MGPALKLCRPHLPVKRMTRPSSPAKPLPSSSVITPLPATPWASPAVALPSINIALFTAFYFQYLHDNQPNAASLLVVLLVPVLVGVPVSSYALTLVSLAYQRFGSPERSAKAAYWGLMSAVWAGSGGLYTLYLGSWEVRHVLDYVILGFGGLVVLVNLAAVVVARAGARRGEISL